MPNIASLYFFIPELILAGVSLLLLAFSFLTKWERWASLFAGFGIAGAFIFTLLISSYGNPPLFWGLLQLDHPAVFFKVIFYLAGLLTIILAYHYERSAEFYSLLVGSILGLNLLSMASNILMIYLSIEFVSLLSYILVGFRRNSPLSNEAGIKYLLFGAVASGVFLFGASLYYGATGTLDVSSLANVGNVPMIAGIFMLGGFLYKIAAVPMQAWCPDAYQGAPTPVTAFLSVAPKAAGFAVLMRVFWEIGGELNWPIIIAIISAFTMTLGNLSAITQSSIKRMLAYSSIAHAGYLLMGVACATQKGFSAIYFYFIAYLIMNIGAFAVVCFLGGLDGDPTIDDVKGLAKRGVLGITMAISMVIFLLSLTGVPPFVGFIGKFYLFSAVIDAKIYWLAFIGIANSVVSLYYYMRIAKAMFFDEGKGSAAFVPSSKLLVAVIILLAFLTVFFGIFWQSLTGI